MILMILMMVLSDDSQNLEVIPMRMSYGEG